MAPSNQTTLSTIKKTFPSKRLIKAIYTSLIIFGLVILHHTWEILLSNTLVKYVLSDVHPEKGLDIIMLCVTVGLLSYLLIYLSRRYIVSGWSTLVITICGGAYAYYRIGNIQWNFIPFKMFPDLFYADILFVIIFVQVILWAKGLISPGPPKKAKGFYGDEPAGKETADELGYEAYVNTLSERISASYLNRSFAIGINGIWGAGKTSFLDFLKRKFNTMDNIIYTDFDPWRCKNPESIIREFFSSVQDALSPFHSGLSSLLIRYAEHLLKQNGNEQIKTATVSFATVSGYDTLDTLYREIDQAIKDIGKQLVVFIDDVDRLDKGEIVV